MEKEREELIDMIFGMTESQFKWFTEQALALLSDEELSLYHQVATVSS